MKYTSYTTFDKPIPYKNLVFYPIKVKDHEEFLFYASSLMIEKNSIKDPVLAIKAISMKYLDWMYEINNKDNNLIMLFDGLLRLVLNKKDSQMEYSKDKSGNAFFRVEDSVYYGEDFDIIRNIIAEQNMLDLPDEKIQKNVREALEEARRFKQKLNKNKMASFEEQMVALSVYMGIEIEKIYEMTIRKFLISIKRANQLIMSNIYLTASLSGFVSFKDKSILKSWIADIDDEDKYADVKMSPDTLQQKANFENAAKK